MGQTALLRALPSICAVLRNSPVPLPSAVSVRMVTPPASSQDLRLTIPGRYSRATPMANRANVQGLTPVGKTAWVQSFQSGEPVVGTPRSGTLGALRISPRYRQSQ